MLRPPPTSTLFPTRRSSDLDPDWQIDQGHSIQIDGLPTVHTTLHFLPPPDFEAKRFEDFMVLGMIITAMPAINAIRSEEHTSELQSRRDIVCRLLLEKKKKI